MWKIGVEKFLMWKIRHYLDLKKKYAVIAENENGILYSVQNFDYSQ